MARRRYGAPKGGADTYVVRAANGEPYRTPYAAGQALSYAQSIMRSGETGPLIVTLIPPYGEPVDLYRLTLEDDVIVTRTLANVD